MQTVWTVQRVYSF